MSKWLELLLIEIVEKTRRLSCEYHLERQEGLFANLFYGKGRSVGFVQIHEAAPQRECDSTHKY